MNGTEKIILAAYDSCENVLEDNEMLNEREKTILTELFENNIPASEMAKKLNISREQVYKLKRKALKKVREYLVRKSMGRKKQFEIMKTEIPTIKGLSKRSKNAMMRNGLTTVEEVVVHVYTNGNVAPKDLFMGMQNVGKKSAAEIVDFLCKNKLILKRSKNIIQIPNLDNS